MLAGCTTSTPSAVQSSDSLEAPAQELVTKADEGDTQGSVSSCDKTGRKPVLDQAQLVYNGGLSARSLAGYSHWQSFTPSISGKLVQIDMAFFNKINADGTLALHFGKGVKGERLYFGPVSVIATRASGNWNSYCLNVDVTAGKPYTFHFTPNLSTMPDPYGVCIGAKASLYTRGAFTHIDPSGEYTYSSQSVFRTYVIPNKIQPDSMITPEAK